MSAQLDENGLKKDDLARLRIFANWIRKVDDDIDDVAASEVLWLAQHIIVSSTETAPIEKDGSVSDTPGRADSSSGETHLDSSPQEPSRRETSERADERTDIPTTERHFFGATKAKRGKHALSASTVRLPAAKALPEALAIGRALRPLSRKFDSPNRQILDEEATAESIAQSEKKIWVPVYRAAPERWFDLALVVEKTPSLDVWQQTIIEFHRLLVHCGVFSDVRLWSLQADDGDVRLFSATGVPHDHREIMQATGRRLFVFVSDCVSEAWRTGKIPGLLAEWSQTSPLAVAQVLPRNLWFRTCLGEPVASLSALRAGLPNKKLRVNRAHQEADPDDPTNLVAAPAFALDPAAISVWARTLMAAGGVTAEGVLLSDASRSELPTMQPAASSMTAEDRIQRFRGMASTDAFRLSTFFSVSTLTMPVMRLIQQAMLPDSPTSILAEVILGGILERKTTGDETPKSADEVAYEFLPGVRDALRGLIRRREARQVIKCVSTFVHQRWGHPFDFNALTPDPAGNELLPADARPFAREAAEMMRRLDHPMPSVQEVVLIKEPSIAADTKDRLAVYVHGDTNVVSLIQSYVNELKEQSLEFVLTTDQRVVATYLLSAGTDQCVIKYRETNQLIQGVEGHHEEAVSYLFSVLKQIADWERALVLQNHATKMDKQWVDFKFFELLDDGKEHEHPGSEITLDITKENEGWKAIRGKMKANNRSAQPLHMALVHLSDDFGIQVPYNERVEPTESYFTLTPAGEAEFTASLDEDEGDEAVHRLMLIVSTEKIDDLLLTQDPLKIGEIVNFRSRGLRGLGFGKPRKKLVRENEWFTKTLSLKLVRQRDRVSPNFALQETELDYISPFIFYRRSNHLFWSNFSEDSRLSRFGNEKTRTWLQGHLHVETFGTIKNAHGEIVYEVNDFDESIIADYQYDLWSMATSLVLAARQNEIAEDEQSTAVDAFANAYLQALLSYEGNDTATETYFTKDNTCKVLSNFLKEVQKEKTRTDMLKKWTSRVKGKRYFLPPQKMKLPLPVTENLAPISESERITILQAMRGYGKTLKGSIKYDEEYFEVEDIAQRVLAGTDSRGRTRYYVLIKVKGRDDDHILDVKLQSRPTAYHFLSRQAQNEFDTCFPDAGERHAAAYRALVTTKNKEGKTQYADDLLGSMQLFDRTYSVRERSPYKETFPTVALKSMGTFVEMCTQWGEILATEHERAHYNYTGKPELYSLSQTVAELTKGREQDFVKQVSDLARSYAGQVEQDFLKRRDSRAGSEGLTSRPSAVTSLLSNDDKADAITRMKDGLQSKKYRWRAIERLAIIAGVTEEQAHALLAGQNDVVLSKGKSGRLIARLSHR